MLRPQLITSAWREVNRRGEKQKKKWKGLQRRKSLVPFDQSTCEGFSELSVCLWGTLQINRSSLFPGCIFSKGDGKLLECQSEKGKKYTLTRSLELTSYEVYVSQSPTRHSLNGQSGASSSSVDCSSPLAFCDLEQRYEENLFLNMNYRNPRVKHRGFVE